MSPNLCLNREMKASQILERTAVKYANCLSYSDSGLVEFDTPDDLHETICFRTRFERPSLFTFEWQDYGPNRGKTEEYSLLWSVNGEAETIYRRGNHEKTMANPLPQAIAGATGASAGAAHLISSLLIEDVGGLKILELDELVLLDHPSSTSQAGCRVSLEKLADSLYIRDSGIRYRTCFNREMKANGRFRCISFVGSCDI